MRQAFGLLACCLLAAGMITTVAAEHEGQVLRRLQADPADRRAIGGQFQLLGVKPIAVAHAKQLPGTNEFLLMEFGPTGPEGKLMLPHPPENTDGKNPLQVWDRDTDKWTNIPTKVNSICGGWAKLPNGQIGLFSGHYQTLNYTQVFGMNRIMLFDPSTYTITPRQNLTAQRWYPTALTLPSGETYIPGGTWAQKPNGTWPKAIGADIYYHAYNSVQQVKMNPTLFNAGIGNWYMGALVLPTGKVAVVNKNMMQVIDVYSGDALAQAPALPASVKDLTWEFPRMGPQVHLKAPVMEPGKAVRLEFIAFGGSNINSRLANEIYKCGPSTCDRMKNQFNPCADVSVRIGLTVKADGGYQFDNAWQVEKMPDKRCIFDGILLPNGHVALLGGQRLGIGDLTNVTNYNGGNQPHNEPWIYRPNAPAGQRYLKTGVFTRIARLYHATSLLTSAGDIIIGGSSNAGFYQTSTPSAFDRTKLGVNEYRMEVYTPPYLFAGNRPAYTTRPPTFAPYGSSFTVGYALPKAGDISGVVLMNTGGVTHNYAIGHRAQDLAFTAKKVNATHGTLTIKAPADSNIAPPAHYLLFLLVGDAYSAGAWVQIKPAVPTLPTTISNQASYVPQMSSTFEGSDSYKLFVSGGANGTFLPRSPSARGSGSTGFHALIKKSGRAADSLALRSKSVALKAGKRCYMHVWMRSSSPRTVSVSLVEVNGSKFTPVATNTLRVTKGYSLRVTPEMKVNKDGNFAMHINMGAGPAGTLDIDDVEVYCEK